MGGTYSQWWRLLVFFSSLSPPGLSRMDIWPAETVAEDLYPSPRRRPSNLMAFVFENMGIF